MGNNFNDVGVDDKQQELLNWLPQESLDEDKDPNVLPIEKESANLELEGKKELISVEKSVADLLTKHLRSLHVKL